MSITILLADDHKIVRHGLRALLEKEADMEVIAEADNGKTAVELARELSPHVVIMDIAMPNLNGVEATRQVTAEAPSVKVIALSIYSGRRFIEGMLSAGASGYLLKDCAFDELARAIRAVIAHQIYLSPSIAGIVVKDYVRHLPISHSSDLTPREREVLQLLAEGKPTTQIASYLSVSRKTIDTHRQHIMDKLNTHSIAELTKYAIREGLTSLEV